MTACWCQCGRSQWCGATCVAAEIVESCQALCHTEEYVSARQWRTAPPPPQRTVSTRDMLMCPVCLETVVRPHVLPECGHSFCLRCLTGCAAGARAVRCPACRKENVLADARPNYALMQVLDGGPTVMDSPSSDVAPGTTSRYALHMCQYWSSCLELQFNASLWSCCGIGARPRQVAPSLPVNDLVAAVPVVAVHTCIGYGCQECRQATVVAGGHYKVLQQCEVSAGLHPPGLHSSGVRIGSLAAGAPSRSTHQSFSWLPLCS